MNQLKKQNHTKVALFASAMVLMVLSLQSRAQSTDDVLINKLEQKGILTVDEAKEIRAEAAAEQTNLVDSALMTSKWKMADSIKNMQLYGDLRFRYEYRGADNVYGGFPSTFYRERMRYALRVGVRGDLYDDYSYGIRLETSNSPRSPWVTLGNNTTSGSVTPSDKNASGIYVGQAYLNWHPAGWYEMSVGRMPMPLYTTPMVWSPNLNPEGAFEKFKYTIGPVDLFVDFGQWVYQDPSSASEFPSSDSFMMTWQGGANVRIGENVSFKVAPMIYTYYGHATTNSGLGEIFVGQGTSPTNVNVGVPGGTSYNGLTAAQAQQLYNEEGIDNLLVLEIPAEFDFKIWNSAAGLGTLQGRLFGDYAYNIKGDERARAAFRTDPAAFPGLKSPKTGLDKAYQVGFGVGSAGPVYGPTQGLVYGSTSKKNTWEARVYWQHIEQYALDVNLLDSDFFEGRGNLQGIYTAFAYSFTDAIIGTVRYGYANQIDGKIGTGGNNLDIPGINPIRHYNIFQADLTWRF